MINTHLAITVNVFMLVVAGILIWAATILDRYTPLLYSMGAVCVVYSIIDTVRMIRRNRKA